MHHSDLHFKIEKEQHAKMIALLEAIAVMFFAIVTAALLPSLLVQYLFKDGQMPTSNPAILTYMPHAIYGISALTFVWAFVTNAMRARKIKQYEEELEMMALSGDCCCGQCDGECNCGDEEMMMVEPSDEVPAAKTRSSRSAAKKPAAKKSSKTARSSKK